MRRAPSHLDVTSLPSPPTSWLSAKDMKMFGATPLTSSTDIGIVRCKDCDKPVLKSAIADHAVTSGHSENCKRIKLGPINGKKNVKGKAAEDDLKKGKKRKFDEGMDDGPGPPNKKARPAPKITKGRAKGPVDYDKQCGVINDKGLPCSRSLTCKSHSMGAKRSVLGRSRPYDELLLDWNRAHNPNFVEPVKRETKAEKKEKKDREREEKRRLKELQGEMKKGLKKTTKGGGKKKGTKDGKGLQIQSVNDGEDEAEAGDEDIDSEAEMESLVRALRMAKHKGLIGVPLATADEMNAGTFFVARRERLRNCKDLLAGALARRTLATSSRMG
ncbi:SCA7, zinc-binding domain-containing protein [Hysterangium stoloniferum]|nr:SCA7, zinc-binding domain-containing protein [Hysterangium stoloniferum]